MADDNESFIQAARDRKRAATSQLSRDGGDGEEEVEPTGPTKAPPEVLAQRKILKVVIPPALAAAAAGGTGGAFSSLGRGPKPPSPALGPKNAGGAPPGFGGVSRPAFASKALPQFNFGKSPSAPATTPSTQAAPVAAAPTVAAPTPAPVAAGANSLTAKPNPSAIPSVFGAGASFKFSFSAPPPAAKEPTVPKVAPIAPLPALTPVEVAVDPNDVEVFHRAGLKLLHFDELEKQWKERGEVTGKVVVNKAAEHGKAILGLFAAKTLKSMLTTPLGANFKVAKREEKQFSFIVVEKAGAAPQRYLLRGPKDNGVAIIAELLKVIDEAQQGHATA